ncbi:hypothetical protein NKH10_28300 [Mesorhizobium sp. M1340]|uniref:DUF6946 family protein n=1 Tax=Mesorhizobium sp. M1340 TaxID=2957087 RepID=UPI00333A52D0
MSRVYVPSSGPDSWQAFLADPAKHWRIGYSARTLAHSWEQASGLPSEVAAMFDKPAELLVALPEHKVPLAGGGRDSQSDVFALIRFGEETCAAAIEGKVNEPFGPTVGEWFAEPSDGKRLRMLQICDLLGLDTVPPSDVRYQLLHRTASALLEAKRFKTDEAAMIVQSFSISRMWFADFERFVSLFGILARPDQSIVTVLKSAQRLRLGWATGNPEHLSH